MGEAPGDQGMLVPGAGLGRLGFIGFRRVWGKLYLLMPLRDITGFGVVCPRAAHFGLLRSILGCRRGANGGPR